MAAEDESQFFQSLQCELNVLSKSDGSALMCQGQTAVLVSVNGPVEVKVQKILTDKATIDTIFRPKSGQPGIRDRTKEALLTNVCEIAVLSSLHPRTGICIVIQEMHDAGGLIACAVNACCLALINSGLPMKFLVAAVTCILTNESELILDSATLKPSKASFVFVFDSIEFKVVASHTTGEFSDEEYMTALHKCKEASRQIFEFYKKTILTYSNRLGLRTNEQLKNFNLHTISS